nr:myelin basic protein-specific T cell receptor V beta chain {clone 1B1} [mice, SJL, mesenteric lymph nodes, regulatory T cells, Peptide Partial, 24 aa] [Mus sp.]
CASSLGGSMNFGPGTRLLVLEDLR